MGVETASAGTGVTELFQLLRDGVPRTRAQLAKSTGLARSTIAARVDELMRMGLVTPVAEAASTGGRPPSQFALNPGARVVVAADIGASHATVAITDLGATILAERTEPLDITLGPVPVLTWTLETALALLADTGRAHATSRRSASASRGRGVLHRPPGQPADHARLGPLRHPRLGATAPRGRVLVDNDVNIMALGERATAWPGTEHLMFVKIATGIGAGVISGGQLLRGAQGVAGDIGHVRVARGSDVPCSCGNRGCLEALASGPAIARELRGQGVDAANGNDVVDLVKHGNIDAIQAVRQAGRDIGEVLTACVSLMNPSVIAIGGSMARVGEHLIAGVREVVYTRSTPLATEHLSIVQSSAAENAGVRGASMLAIEHALSPAALHMLVSA